VSRNLVYALDASLVHTFHEMCGLEALMMSWRMEVFPIYAKTVVAMNGRPVEKGLKNVLSHTDAARNVS
jgi:hypothetical protein